MNETRMTDDEWAKILELMASLWPKHAPQLSDVQLSLWRDALGRFPTVWVSSTMRGMYQRSKFFPKIPEIAAECRAIKARTAISPPQADGRARQEDAEREKIAAEWREIDAAIDQLSNADLWHHLLRVVAANPHLVFLAATPVLRRSLGVKAQILKRIQQGLGATEDWGMAWSRGGFDKDRNWVPGGREFRLVELSPESLATAASGMKAKRSGMANVFEVVVTGGIPSAATQEEPG